MAVHTRSFTSDFVLLRVRTSPFTIKRTNVKSDWNHCNAYMRLYFPAPLPHLKYTMQICFPGLCHWFGSLKASSFMQSLEWKHEAVAIITVICDVETEICMHFASCLSPASRTKSLHVINLQQWEIAPTSNMVISLWRLVNVLIIYSEPGICGCKLLWRSWGVLAELTRRGSQQQCRSFSTSFL